jgi:flagellar basal-body rod protein FlgB
MDNPAQTWFQLASRRMEWLSSRQTVIAENIANANTPGYAGRDVQPFEDFLDANQEAGRGALVEDAPTMWGGSKDGNTVVLEEQAILATQSAGEFRLASRLYAKGYQLVALAAGRR